MALLVKNGWIIEHKLIETPKVSLLDAVLNARGLVSDEDKKVFLSPDLSIGHDPFLFHDMIRACEVIADAIHRKAKIVVYGDYDVDGITSTSMLILFLQMQKAVVEFVIPDRILDGYGLTDFGVCKIMDMEAKIVITVDCGIASVNEVQKLTENGIKVVLTDHHECKTVLPAATAVLNPKRPDSQYPFRDLAGAGVVLKLIQALCIRMELGDLWKSTIDLAAIGTIADVVPLCGENRTIAYHGLEEMNRNSSIGVKSLLDVMDKSGKAITATTISYGIAPRINAAGRMGDSSRAVHLLTASDCKEAVRLAADLILDNKKRQEIEIEIFEEAKAQIKETYCGEPDGILVVYKKGWHQGVIGIVASRLVELYNRSVIIFGGEEDYYKGSARSANGGSILEAIEFAGKHVLQFGGHKKAAGLVVRDDRMTAFLQAMKEFSREHPEENAAENTIRIDFEIDFTEITLSNARALSSMAPFGEGNAQPVFVSRNLRVEQIRFLSSGKHMKLILSQAFTKAKSGMASSMNTIDAIAFGFLEENSNLAAGDIIDAAYAMELNEWNGNSTVQINIKDIRRTINADMERLCELEDRYVENPDRIWDSIRDFGIALQDVIPQKTEFIAVYQHLKTHYSQETVLCDLDLLSVILSNNNQISISVFKLARIFDIFKEVDMIHFQTLGRFRIKFKLLEVKSKVSLHHSRTYKVLCPESVIL